MKMIKTIRELKFFLKKDAIRNEMTSKVKYWGYWWLVMKGHVHIGI